MKKIINTGMSNFFLKKDNLILESKNSLSQLFVILLENNACKKM